MYRKQIEHLIAIGLKYFFDLDYTFFNHIIVVALVMLGICRFFISQITLFFTDGIDTVKEDMGYFRQEWDIIKDNWNNSHLKATLTNNVRGIKNNIPQNIS